VLGSRGAVTAPGSWHPESIVKASMSLGVRARDNKHYVFPRRELAHRQTWIILESPQRFPPALDRAVGVEHGGHAGTVLLLRAGDLSPHKNQS
jgi:hypothetical protein